MIDFGFSTFSTRILFMMEGILERPLGLGWTVLVRLSPWGLDIGVWGLAFGCWFVVIIVLICGGGFRVGVGLELV